jgi:hypothetical protein
MKSIIIAYVAIVLFCVIGWIMGLVKFCKCDFEPSYKAEVLYGVGTCTGLGAVIGWFDFGK